MELYKQKLDAAAKGDRASSLELLEFIRKEKIRAPDVCVKVGQKLIANGGLSADNLYTVYEQTLLAALDINEQDLVDKCIEALKSKFPDSSRVQRLELMILEARGNFSQADAFYKDMLTKNPSNMLIMKRQVAIYKAQGKIDDAIAKLNALLKNFQTDAGSWIELAELYLAGGNYVKAAFCFEELILTNPLSAFYHERLAEIYITIGGVDNLKLARKHLAHSIELNDTNNARALMALIMCTSTLASLKLKVEKEEKDLNKRLHQLAVSKLHTAYNQNATEEVVSIADEVVAATKESFDD
ncbi:unnamed protein product [Aphanomyces euteiches]|uniref:ER membrane protein complex subunit 2 n=1 Tax=Aphanomyces euteiches TaxID=100861 RepID=A0A6G0WJF9_9STRA|nr:hypothetical protein Ae201684_014628 [Aphanomyces euteiches]KAH9081014.1 hypothetical protein Ae201684P_011988 [Aphanomyces euteiches]KAH9152886.1 hypothetical protein AeRB84_004779 [Aphanomyces euteiches]